MKLHMRPGFSPGRFPGMAVAVLASLLPGLLINMTATNAADPSDPAAASPGVAYRSAFQGYERWRDGPKAPWRDSNDTVARMGGHMGHVEETAPPQAPASGQPAAGQPPAGGGGQHQQHKP